jgi:hypothetical protein
MAKKEEKVVETTEEVKSEGGNMKVTEKAKKATKPKQLGKVTPDIAKVDLTKAESKDVEKSDVAKVDLSKKEEVEEEVPVVEEIKEEEVKEEVKEEETPILEEITDEEEKPVEEKVEEVAEEITEAIEEAKETGEPLPENIQKVVDFMNETGGSLDEYVKLNQDYSKLDDNQLLREYYKQTKTHLTDDEISFLMEDQFSVDEDVDEERDIRRKKLALKEQVASAKNHLDGLKSKYYEEIKAGVKLTPDQQKAVEFFGRYNKEQSEIKKVQEQRVNLFKTKTSEVFSDKFKGFEYNIGEKKFRLNVKDPSKVKTTQSDINNFVKKFTNDKNEINDAAGYHKSLFTAMNPDVIANHFYEQGKADAVKESVAKAKNVSMDPRQSHSETIEAGGMRVRAIAGDNSRKLRVKIRK